MYSTSYITITSVKYHDIDELEENIAYDVRACERGGGAVASARAEGSLASSVKARLTEILGVKPKIGRERSVMLEAFAVPPSWMDARLFADDFRRLVAAAAGEAAIVHFDVFDGERPHVRVGFVPSADGKVGWKRSRTDAFVRAFQTRYSARAWGLAPAM